MITKCEFDQAAFRDPDIANNISEGSTEDRAPLPADCKLGFLAQRGSSAVTWFVSSEQEYYEAEP